MTRYDASSARRLLHKMGRLVVPLPSAVEEQAMVQRTSARLELLLGELAEQGFARRRRRRYLAFAAAALVPLGFIGASFGLLSGKPSHSARIAAASGAVNVSRAAGGDVPAAVGNQLHAGDTVRTPPGARAALELADRARVGCAAGTEVRLSREGAEDSRLELSRGSISFEVPKLAPGHTLSVETRDAVVTVRGTRFTVTVAGAESKPLTRVSVSEGRVQVDSARGTVFLGPGEQWSSRASEPAAPATVDAPATSPPAAHNSEPAAPSSESVAADSPRARAPTSRPNSNAEGRSSSTLRDENVLYERALRRAEASDAAGALADLEALVARHPRSPLVQSARVEHFRILLRVGNRSLAASEARRYLSDYPDGFARSEAKNVALLARSPE